MSERLNVSVGFTETTTADDDSVTDKTSVSLAVISVSTELILTDDASVRERTRVSLGATTATTDEVSVSDSARVSERERLTTRELVSVRLMFSVSFGLTDNWDADDSEMDSTSVSLGLTLT